MLALGAKVEIAGAGRQEMNEPKEPKAMSGTPSRRMKIGDFLLRRLAGAGVRHLFGVPGDY
jgi:hypothetical protein